MIFTCSALEKKSKCYIWKNLYQQNLEGCCSQCTQSHRVKFSVLKVQCVSWYNLHTAWFCRFGLLLYKPLTEPKPSGIHTLNVQYGLLGNHLLDICLFITEKMCYGGGLKIILVHCKTFSKMGYIPPKSQDQFHPFCGESFGRNPSVEVFLDSFFVAGCYWLATLGI